MPIKNLSDVRRLPRLGKIALGIKKKSSGGKEYPAEVDYFVCPQIVQKIFGEKPKELRIMFPVNNAEVFFQQWYKHYGKSALKCKGDGELAYAWDEEKGGIKEVPCPCSKLEAGECKQIGTLQFLLPDIPGAGVWQITTSSKNSIIDLNSSIDFVRAVAGRINMIPLILKREQRDMTRVEGGVQKKSTHHTLKLDIADGFTLRQLQEAAQVRAEMVLLPPADESRDDLLYPENGFAEEKPDEKGGPTQGMKAGSSTIDDLPEGEDDSATTEQMADVATWVSQLKERGKKEKQIYEEINRIVSKQHKIAMNSQTHWTIEIADTAISFLKAWAANIDSMRAKD